MKAHIRLSPTVYFLLALLMANVAGLVLSRSLLWFCRVHFVKATSQIRFEVRRFAACEDLCDERPSQTQDLTACAQFVTLVLWKERGIAKYKLAIGERGRRDLFHQVCGEETKFRGVQMVGPFVSGTRRGNVAEDDVSLGVAQRLQQSMQSGGLSNATLDKFNSFDLPEGRGGRHLQIRQRNQRAIIKDHTPEFHTFCLTNLFQLHLVDSNDTRFRDKRRFGSKAFIRVVCRRFARRLRRQLQSSGGHLTPAPRIRTQVNDYSISTQEQKRVVQLLQFKRSAASVLTLQRIGQKIGTNSSSLAPHTCKKCSQISFPDSPPEPAEHIGR